MDRKRELELLKTDEKNKVSYALKKQIVDQICNGQISKNGAATIYNINRSTIEYWLNKWTSLEQKSMLMGSKNEIKKLKDKIEELELLKDFQQDLIANFEIETGKEWSKKFLPEQLAKEIAAKKKNLK